MPEEGLCEESYPVMLKRHYIHGLSSCLSCQSVCLRKDCVRSLTQSLLRLAAAPAVSEHVTAALFDGNITTMSLHYSVHMYYG